MKLIVFGATGKVGRQVVEQAITKGHTVTAFVHGDPGELTDKGGVKIVKGDVHNLEDVRKVVDGCEGVISALGSWGTPTKDIQVAAMKHIIPCMEAHDIKRIVSITGADAQVEGEEVGAINHLAHTVLGAIAPKVLYDGEEHIRLLSESDLDWTVLRSPVMRLSDKTAYKLSKHHPSEFSWISRAAVAAAMVELVASRQFYKSAPYISS